MVSGEDRLKALGGAIVAPAIWYYFFGADIDRLAHTPFARLTLSDVYWVAFGLLLFFIIGRVVIQLLHEAMTGEPWKWWDRE
jgi:hypothetical protein